LDQAVERVPTRQTQQILERLSPDPVDALRSLPLPRLALEFLVERETPQITDWGLFFQQLSQRMTHHPKWVWPLFVREYDLLRAASTNLLQAGTCCLSTVDPVSDGRAFNLAPAANKMTDLHRCLIDTFHYRYSLRRVVRVILRRIDCSKWMEEKSITPTGFGVRRYRLRCIRRWEAFLLRGRPLPPELQQEISPPSPDFDRPQSLEPDFQAVIDSQPP
jgi:hypothetical protein